MRRAAALYKVALPVVRLKTFVWKTKHESMLWTNGERAEGISSASAMRQEYASPVTEKKKGVS